MTRSDSRPRLLLVTRNLPPLVGGMEKLNHRLVLGLSSWADVEVVGPRGSASVFASLTVREVPASPLWRFLPAATFQAFAAARRQRPHVVLAGSGLTAPMAAIAARVTGARAAVYLHGLDLVARHPIYRSVWLPAIRRVGTVMANSRNTGRLAEAAGVEGARLRIVHPGTDLPRPDPASRARWRDRHGFGNRPVLLSVGRLTPRKGLTKFVANALPLLRARHPDLVLAVVGDDASDALKRTGSGRAELVAAAQAAGLEDAVRLLGPCSDVDLLDAYSAADIHVFPVLDTPGDVEGFGMVAIEAAAMGLPTVAFDVGGVGDAVSAETGDLLAPGDYAGFVEAIARRLEDGTDADRCRHAAARFSWPAFDAAVRGVLEPLAWRAIRDEQSL